MIVILPSPISSCAPCSFDLRVPTSARVSNTRIGSTLRPIAPGDARPARALQQAHSPLRAVRLESPRRERPLCAAQLAEVRSVPPVRLRAGGIGSTARVSSRTGVLIATVSTGCAIGGCVSAIDGNATAGVGSFAASVASARSMT